MALQILPLVNDYGNEEDVDDGGGDDMVTMETAMSITVTAKISDILVTTKSGRTCRTWRERYLNYFVRN